ncbi:GAF and ANTAR domain-containing protein [Streptomyces tauricus]|uniref:GAF and ANTAR domain-containing protein n=1 Tax=Streptomyces tauricus TaxID=68274 RepID=UPI0037FD81F1
MPAHESRDRPGLQALLDTARQAGQGLSGLPAGPAAATLGLDGLTISLTNRAGLEVVWYDPGQPAGTALEDLQYTLGEGPTLDAARTGHPVTVPDLHTEPEHRWPALLPATRHHPPRAVFALPLHLGAIRLGALTGHRTTPGPLTPTQMTQVLLLTETATTLLLTPDGIHDIATDQPLPLHRAVVHQATGALSVRLNIPIDQALIRLRAYAFTHNRPLEDIAYDVIHHHYRLDNHTS